MSDYKNCPDCGQKKIRINGSRAQCSNRFCRFYCDLIGYEDQKNTEKRLRYWAANR